MRIIRVLLFLLVPILLVFVAGVVSIGYSVGKYCKTATDLYHSDCASSLLTYITDEQNIHDLRVKSVWAIGQIADPRSVIVLESLEMNNFCQGDNSCEYEITKAIRWCSTDKNKLSPIWRELFL
ncbi:MAG: hypothetical protein WC243_03285 [Patescibacteria group bacterium]|jgi:hypothetical protein